ncbi:MAG: sn-glycerol-3-phosphate ABC transporter ATP-binding protein UgpC, partial [Pseudomonadota bacterium]
MAAVELNTIRKFYGDYEATKGVSFRIEDGEFIVFVGPSGCGKSTLLRMIAGLEEISSGDLLFDGERVNAMPPAKRGIGMVFQSYALYPHMTVKENIAFGLKLAKTPKSVIEERVSHAARILQLEPMLARKPSALSGGQRQRVAIGRAIVRSPRVFLFDEPLSNLDAALRVQMRIEIAKLHRELKATMIYVTHDQVEAMTLADRIVVLEAGHIRQIGSPLELFTHPANRFVAGFIGSPKMNFISGHIADIGEDWIAFIPKGEATDVSGNVPVRLKTRF